MLYELLTRILHALEDEHPQDKFRFNVQQNSIRLESRTSYEFIDIEPMSMPDMLLTTYYVDNAECRHLYQVKQSFEELIQTI